MNDDGLPDDICRNNHGGDPLSEAANLATLPRKARDRAKLLAYVDGRGPEGSTADEALHALGMLSQTVYPRFSELKRDGDLVKTDRRRLSREGRCLGVVCVTRRVWEAEQARLALRRPEQMRLL